MLLDPQILVDLVRVIEKDIPGYWYSIYQRKYEDEDEIVICGGPTLACPSQFDRDWAMTRSGDKGFEIKFGTDQNDLVSATREKIELVLHDAGSDITEPGGESSCQKYQPRVQSEEDLFELGKNYNKIRHILEKASLAGFELEEYHIGSCHTSADSTIRGRLNGVELTEMVDLIDGNIASAIWMCASDLTMTIMSDLEVCEDNKFTFGSIVHPGLSKVIEESGELVDVLGKMVSVGGCFDHWSGNLRAPLRNELADVSAAIDFYVAQPQNMSDTERAEFFDRKMRKIARFEYFNEIQKSKYVDEPSVTNNSSWFGRLFNRLMSY